MNRTMIIYILGCILKTEGVLMALPCLVALIYHESQGIAYVIVAVLSLIAGMLLTIRKPKDYIIYLKEGCIATSLSWILMGIVGSFPFMITERFHRLLMLYLKQFQVLQRLVLVY